MKKAGALATIAAAIAFVAVAAPAQAATTIGSSPPPPPPPGSPMSSCGTFSVDADAVQISTGAGITPYAVPAGGGVITSWKTGTIGAGTTRLRVFSPDSNSATVTPVGESDRVTLGPTAPPSQPTRISVAGGEKLGLTINSPNATDCLSASDDSANQGAVSGSAPLGQPTPTISGGGGSPLPGLLSVSAVVEPDADKDGYGDETQDLCPTQASTQGTCGNVKVGKPKINSKKGTAKVAVSVPGTGIVKLSGKTIAAQTKQAKAAGKVTLLLKPKGAAKKKLAAKGKLKVKATATFTPTGGEPIEQAVKATLTLKKK